MTTPAERVLVIGGGVAGLALALDLADHRPVTLLRPASDDAGASRWAQGGIAAVLAPDDDIESHVADTLVAGAGLCDEAAVRFTVTQGPEAIDWLLALGVPFTPDPRPEAPYPYHLTREGGHGARRIIHAADATGRAVIETLVARAQAHPRITLCPSLTAIGLLRDAHGACRGARCLDDRGQETLLLAGDTVLASGGASGLYRHTTSPAPTRGEGMLMAAELGAPLMNLEFQQFHPTCLYDPQGAPFLISEAVRGEGGILRNLAGERFMPALDDRAELAPRDIVARAIDAQMQREGGEHVWLDISHLPAATIRRLFPTIQAHCLARGLDITRAPIPVVPAAHYSCGGVVTDLNGATEVVHLYAIGEVAATGLHGANRMASNSLLECLVFARAAARVLRRAPREWQAPRPAASSRGEPPAASRVAALQGELGEIMSRRVAIVRDDAGLAEAEARLRELGERVSAEWRHHAPTVALASLWHSLRLARLTVRLAQARRESRGLHYNRDCPSGAADPRPSFIGLDALD
ncbi:L-aspartate oxidase [Halomonas sp. NCCP-2165]|nr:L-aspartate oxidase [Halomonas sp. NCCP-2165]GKW49458.1 L-aspartate oxidase [Halomonas sp. NCCP-2165]